MFVCYDGFEPTRLNPACFPTADQLNHGTGPLMEQREARFAARHTGAFMSNAQLRFVDRNPERYMNTPHESEEYFEERVGEDVRDDYLALFERALYRIHLWCELVFMGLYTKLDGEDEREQCFKCVTDVIAFDITLCAYADSPKEVVLFLVNTRPCAESFGFARILLYELARNCVHYGATLQVSDTYPATKDILRRAWGDGSLTEKDHMRYTPEEIASPARQLGVAGLLLPPLDPRRKKRGRSPSFLVGHPQGRR